MYTNIYIFIIYYKILIVCRERLLEYIKHVLSCELLVFFVDFILYTNHKNIILTIPDTVISPVVDKGK